MKQPDYKFINEVKPVDKSKIDEMIFDLIASCKKLPELTFREEVMKGLQYYSLYILYNLGCRIGKISYMAPLWTNKFDFDPDFSASIIKNLQSILHMLQNITLNQAQIDYLEYCTRYILRDLDARIQECHARGERSSLFYSPYAFFVPQSGQWITYPEPRVNQFSK